MTSTFAFHLLEKGEARCVCASLLIIRMGEEYFISFDGERWEETRSDIIIKEFND